LRGIASRFSIAPRKIHLAQFPSQHQQPNEGLYAKEDRVPQLNGPYREDEPGKTRTMGERQERLR
jgi:hypothetical protein